MSNELETVSPFEVGDMNWDNIEETAPAVADVNEDGNVKDDWDDIPETSEEVKVDASEEVSEESGEESKEVDNKVEASAEEDKVGEAESGEEDSKGIALTDETEIEVKVDGNVEKISLKELKSNYSGKVAYDKKFSDLDKERKSYKAEVEEINGYVEELGKTMKESSILDGFYKVGELVGMAPHQLKQSLIQELIPEIQRLQGLPEDQVSLEYKKQETEYMSDKYEADQKKMQKEQASSELQRSVDSIRDANSIDDPEWDSAIDYLDGHLPAGDEITPELVGKYVNFSRADARAEKLLNEFDATLVDNKDVRNSLQDAIYENPSLNNEDFIELLNDAYGTAKVDVAEKAVKVKAKNPAKKSQKEEMSAPSPIMVGEEEALDWDDVL